VASSPRDESVRLGGRVACRILDVAADTAASTAVVARVSRAKSQPKVDRLDHKGWPMVADQLILQTVFLGVLAAVIVNIRSRPRKKPREKVARAASF